MAKTVWQWRLHSDAESAVQAMNGHVTAVVEPRENDVYVVNGDDQASRPKPMAGRDRPGGHAEGT